MSSLAADLAVSVDEIQQRYAQMRRETANMQNCFERNKKRRLHLTPGTESVTHPHVSNTSSVATSRAPSFDSAEALEHLQAVEEATAQHPPSTVSSRAPSLECTANSLDAVEVLEAATEWEAAASSAAPSYPPPIATLQGSHSVLTAGQRRASARPRPLATSGAGVGDASAAADTLAPSGVVAGVSHEGAVVSALMAMKASGAGSSTDGSDHGQAPPEAAVPSVRVPVSPQVPVSAESVSALARATLQQLGRVQVIMEPTSPFRVVSVSSGWERLCGLRSWSIKGRTLAPIQGPMTDHAAVAKLVEAARKKEPTSARLINYDRLGRAFEHVVCLDMLQDPSGATKYVQATSLVLQPPGTCVQPLQVESGGQVEKAFKYAHMLSLASWVEYRALMKHSHISTTHPVAEVAMIQESARRRDAHMDIGGRSANP